MFEKIQIIKVAEGERYIINKEYSTGAAETVDGEAEIIIVRCDEGRKAE